MRAMEPVIRIGRRQLPGPTLDPLGLAVALCLENGMTEAEALCRLHSGVLRRADALGVRLEGENE
jgi:hypothetical protein